MSSVIVRGLLSVSVRLRLCLGFLLLGLDLGVQVTVAGASTAAVRVIVSGESRVLVGSEDIVGV